MFAVSMIFRSCQWLLHFLTVIYMLDRHAEDMWRLNALARCLVSNHQLLWKIHGKMPKPESDLRCNDSSTYAFYVINFMNEQIPLQLKRGLLLNFGQSFQREVGLWFRLAVTVWQVRGFLLPNSLSSWSVWANDSEHSLSDWRSSWSAFFLVTTHYFVVKRCLFISPAIHVHCT